MGTGHTGKPQRISAVGGVAEAATQDAHLADAAMALLGCRREVDVYGVVCDFMVKLCPGVVVVADEITPDMEFFITRGIAGAATPMLSKAASLMGFELVGKKWPILPEFRNELLKGALVKIPGGFADLAANDIPRPVATAITKAFGIRDLYVIGIADREHALGNFAIITRSPDVVLPTNIVGAFARHCYSAIANIRRLRELELSQTMLTGILDAVPQAIFWKNADGVYLGCNRKFAETVGRGGPQQVIGKTDYDLPFDSAQVDSYRQDDREVLSSSRPKENIVEQAVSADGVPFWADTTKVPLVDGAGKPYAVLGVSSDISRDKLAGETLKESERWLSESQRVAHLGHYVFDIQADRWTGSPSLYDVLGVDEDYVKDFDGWLDVVATDDRERLSRYVTEDVLGRRRPFDIEYGIVRPRDGAERWVHGLGTVEFADDGRALEMFGVIQDITERRRTDELLAESLSSIIAVVGRVVETRDPYTAGHERRVAELAVSIAEEMGMPVLETENIRIAALIHDVGKISVPAEILSKPGRLSALEFELIKCHPQSGYEILAEASMDESIAEMVRQHHERCDGSGYPGGMHGGDILVGAKVLMVADVVEAMVSHRPYRAGLGLDLALAEIERGAGGLYDAGVAESCLSVFRERGFAFSPA